MGGRAVEGTGLENRQTRKGLVGSNPTPSTKSPFVTLVPDGPHFSEGRGFVNLSDQPLYISLGCAEHELIQWVPRDRPTIDGRVDDAGMLFGSVGIGQGLFQRTAMVHDAKVVLFPQRRDF